MSEPAPTRAPGGTPRLRYSEQRRLPAKARSYDTKYEREWHKRLSDRRERRLLAAILERAGPHERLLDVPCGAGRLSGVLARNAERLFEVDYATSMLELAREKGEGRYDPALANASAFELPFGDRAFDLVVSIRLSHHVPDHGDRRRHLRELCRVSGRHVLVTFFDAGSVKNRLRRLRRRLGSPKRDKHTLSRDEVAEVARGEGLRVAGFWRLSTLLSGHTFALLERDRAATGGLRHDHPQG